MREKMNTLKAWARDWSMILVVCTIATAEVVVLVLGLCNYKETTYSVPAKVVAVGYKGISVSYAGAYGKEVTQTVNVDIPAEYKAGDDVFVVTTNGLIPTIKEIRFADTSAYGSRRD